MNLLTDLEISELISRSYLEKTFRINEVEVLIETIGDTIVIVPRGTEYRFQDVLRDLVHIPWDDGYNGLCHGGMASGARMVGKHIKHSYVDYKNVILAGHSLGAAISYLLIARLQSYGFNVMQWVGLGCPNITFGFLHKPPVDVHCKNYRCGNDIISMIPTKLSGFTHPVPRSQIGYACRPWPNFSDHKLKRYIHGIKAIAKLAVT